MCKPLSSCNLGNNCCGDSRMLFFRHSNLVRKSRNLKELVLCFDRSTRSFSSSSTKSVLILQLGQFARQRSGQNQGNESSLESSKFFQY